MTGPGSPSFGSPKHGAARYRELRSKAQNPETRWILLIKEFRAEHGFGIFEAQEMALRDPALRRLVERQINIEPRCRQQAYSHIRENGENSLLEKVGETFRFRDLPIGSDT
jgi:hypothetical protein